MAGLTHHFLLNPLFGQPFLCAKREDRHDKLIAPVAVSPPELDIGSLAAIVVLCLVKPKAYDPCLSETRSAVAASSPHGSNFMLRILTWITSPVKRIHRGSWKGELPRAY